MQDDIGARFDAIAEGFEIGRADDEAETRAAERIGSGRRPARDTDVLADLGIYLRYAHERDVGPRGAVTFAKGVRDDVAGLSMGDTGLETVGGGAFRHDAACLLCFDALKLAGIRSEWNLEWNLG